MKSLTTFLSVALFFSTNISFGNPGDIYLAPDSIPGKVSVAVFKINPIQYFLNEFPISLEIFLRNERSIQFQAGYIFPATKDSFKRSLFESSGLGSIDGLLSPRNSPFNSYGVSIKVEFRKYGKRIYFGPQIMYKNTFYKNLVFPVYNGVTDAVDHTESKFSNIIGFGYVIGRQNNESNIILDWYAAFGFRIRVMSVTTLNIEDPYRRNVTFTPKKENFTLAYPFLNLGVRIGFRFSKTVIV